MQNCFIIKQTLKQENIKMKSTTLYTFNGTKFVANGSKAICGKKIAGKWEGTGRVVWVKKADLYTFDRTA